MSKRTINFGIISLMFFGFNAQSDYVKSSCVVELQNASILTCSKSFDTKRPNVKLYELPIWNFIKDTQKDYIEWYNCNNSGQGYYDYKVSFKIHPDVYRKESFNHTINECTKVYESYKDLLKKNDQQTIENFEESFSECDRRSEQRLPQMGALLIAQIDKNGKEKPVIRHFTLEEEILYCKIEALVEVNTVIRSLSSSFLFIQDQFRKSFSQPEKLE